MFFLSDFCVFAFCGLCYNFGVFFVCCENVFFDVGDDGFCVFTFVNFVVCLVLFFYVFAVKIWVNFVVIFR